MPARAGRDAAEDVAAADDDRRLDAHRLDLGDVLGDLRRHGGIDAVGLLAHQGFAGEFQEDAFVGGDGHGLIIVEDAEGAEDAGFWPCVRVSWRFRPP